MASISQRIPNLLGGISQQPDSLKLPGQVRKAVNCIPDPTYGMLKRPGMKLVGKFDGAVDNGRWFSIFRDRTERYIGQFATDGTMRMWNANTGATMTVNAIAASAKAYMANCIEADFEMLQINDYNFVLNRSKVTAPLATLSSAQNPVALVTVSLVGYGVTYKVNLSGTVASVTTATTGTLDTTQLVADLAAQIASKGFSATVAGTTIIVEKTGGGDFTITGEGGVSSQALLVYKGVVPNVSRLPSNCKDGIILKVSNLEDANGDDYWVKFKVNGNGSVGAGIWEECLAPGLRPFIDPDTMPHVVIRESNGSFTFRSLNQAQASSPDIYWIEREVGDDDTNPFPSFVGNTITGISFFRNRLVLLSGSNVICSQPGSYFNLFRISALAATDGDSVDLSTGSLRPVALRYALSSSLGLVIFAEVSQFILTSEQDLFGPATAQIKQLSTFNTNPGVRPVETGTSVVFVDNNQGYSAVSEMLVTSVDNRPSVADLSRTSPNYVPANLRSVISSSTASMLSFLGEDVANNLKIFKYFNNAQERVLASWIEWNLPGTCVHQSVDHDKLFLVTKQQNGYLLSTVTVISDVEGTALNNADIAYEYRLDLFSANNVRSYNSTTNVTRILLRPGQYDSTLTLQVVVDDTGAERGAVYISPSVVSESGNWYVELPGNRTSAINLVVGYSYEFRLELPVIYRQKSTADRRSQADITSIPRVHRMAIESNDSGPYMADVSLLGRSTKTYEFSQSQSNSYIANTTPLPERITNIIPIYGKGTDARVDLYSTSPFPISLVAITWYGVYSERGITSV